jgi:hypothetical protein
MTSKAFGIVGGHARCRLRAGKRDPSLGTLENTPGQQRGGALNLCVIARAGPDSTRRNFSCFFLRSEVYLRPNPDLGVRAMFRPVLTLALCCGLAAGADAASGSRIPSLLRMRGGVAAAPRKMSVQVVRAHFLDATD